LICGLYCSSFLGGSGTRKKSTYDMKVSFEN
jgi:hypothetical protein